MSHMTRTALVVFSLALEACLGDSTDPGSNASSSDGAASGGGDPAADLATAPAPSNPGPDLATGPSEPTMSFFVSSRGVGKGGDLRANATDTDGLAGADALCKTLATAVSPALGAKT